MAKNKTDVLDRFASAGNEAVGLINRVDDATAKFQPGMRRGSIVKAAQGNVFEFPVFISNSIPLDYATATTSLLEQVYAAYLQMAVSINPVVSADSVKNGLQFADLKTNTNKYLEYTDTTYQHEACHNVIQEDGVQYEFNMLSIEDADARLINEAVDYQPLSEFDHFFQEAVGDDVRDHMQRYPMPRLNAARTQIQYPITFDGYGTLEDLRNHLAGVAPFDFNGSGTLQPAFAGYLGWISSNHIPLVPSIAAVNNADPAGGPVEPAEPSRLQNVNTGLQNGLNTYNSVIGVVGNTAQAVGNVATLPDQIKQAKYKTKIDKDKVEHLDEDRLLKKQDVLNKIKTSDIKYIDDSKCQKLNTMKPLLMSVTLNMLNKDDSLQPINYIIGVKTHSRVVPASILPEVAKYPLKEMDKLSRKVKWRAGELKFLKDLVFRIDEKKQTAADSRDPNRKWYRRLYELAHMKGDAPSAAVVQGKSLFGAFIRDKQGKSKMMHGMIPNASIIMSQQDIDNIKHQTEIDLLKASEAKKFCGELFLISLVIIDTDAQSIKIMLPDMNNDYDVHSLASVEKQLATLDTSGTKTRDMFKMLG